MRTCCICGARWKTEVKKDDILIYGCAVCGKGHCNSNTDKGYFKDGKEENKK